MKIREKIEQLAENSSEVQEATYTSQHKITYQHGYIDGYTQCQQDMLNLIKIEIKLAYKSGQTNNVRIEAGLERDETLEYVNNRMLKLNKQD